MNARLFVPSFIVLLGAPGLVVAGMPSFQLSDVARLRLENVSFFLAGFLLAALGIKLLWNYLAKDWAFLPRLSYGKALGLTTLWGLLFLLVLTMISGARELMTPGAWKKEGATYKLAQPSEQDQGVLDLERRRQLEKLRDALWDFARSHQDHFPADADDPQIAAGLWTLPRTAGLRYVYRGGKLSQPEGTPLAFEAEIFGPTRYVLFTNGHIRLVENADLVRLLAEKK